MAHCYGDPDCYHFALWIRISAFVWRIRNHDIGGALSVSTWNIFWYNLLAEKNISRMQIHINSRARIPSVENARLATGLVVFAKVNLTWVQYIPQHLLQILQIPKLNGLLILCKILYGQYPSIECTRYCWVKYRCTSSSKQNKQR